MMNDYRVSDAEREAVMDELRRHAAAGRLTVEEFGERLNEAHAARTTSQLQAVLRELPRLDAGRDATWRTIPFLRHRMALFALLALVLAISLIHHHHGWLLIPLAWLLFGILRPWSRHHHDRGPI